MPMTAASKGLVGTRTALAIRVSPTVFPCWRTGIRRGLTFGMDWARRSLNLERKPERDQWCRMLPIGWRAKNQQICSAVAGGGRGARTSARAPSGSHSPATAGVIAASRTDTEAAVIFMMRNAKIK